MKLREWLGAPEQQSKIRPETVAQGLAEAVRAWHGAFGVHGRLTPEVVTIKDDGRVTLAESAEAVDEREIYASPRQLKRGRPDKRGDRYALKALTQLILTGQAPFTGATHSEALAKALQGRLPRQSRSPRASWSGRLQWPAGLRLPERWLWPVRLRWPLPAERGPVFAGAGAFLVILGSLLYFFPRHSAPVVAVTPRAAPHYATTAERHSRVVDHYIDELRRPGDCSRRRNAAKHLAALGDASALPALRQEQDLVDRSGTERSCLRGSARKAIKKLAH